VASRLALRGQAGWQAYRNRWSLGEFGGRNDEDNEQANLDAVWSLSRSHELSFGGNFRRYGADLTGQVAADSTDYGAGAPARSLATHDRVDYPGAYLEDKVRLARRLFATLEGVPITPPVREPGPSIRALPWLTC